MNFLIKFRFSTEYFERIILPRKQRQVQLKKIKIYQEVKAKQQALLESGALNPDIKQERYTHTENYNFEQYLKYTKLVREAKASVTTPRSRPKIVKKFDRPKYDTSLNDYCVWPNLHNLFEKAHDNSEIVVCKLFVSPKSLKRALGRGIEASRNSGATREYDFEDSNLDQFLIYDQRQTTQYWGENRSEEFYQQQDMLKKHYRKQKWPTPEEFWQSDEIVPFRVNCTQEADFRRFKAWIMNQIEETKVDFEEALFQKIGKPEYFDDYSKTYQLVFEAPVYKYSRQYFLEKGQKLDQNRLFNDALPQPVRMNDSQRISIEEYKRIQAEEQRERLKQNK